MAVADDGHHALHGSQFRRRALRIAAGNHNAGLRILPVRATDKGAGLAIGLGGYAAGVDDDHIGLVCRLRAMPCRAQLRADCLAIGAGRATAKILDVILRHILSVGEAESARIHRQKSAAHMRFRSSFFSIKCTLARFWPEKRASLRYTVD